MLRKRKRDLMFRNNYKNKEVLTTTIKFLSTNFLNQNNNVNVCNAFSCIKQRNYSKTKIVRRCILTNRGRGAIRPFNISRVKLRELLRVGVLPGYKKSVW